MSCNSNASFVFALAAIATALVECAASDDDAALLAAMLVAVADSVDLLSFDCDEGDAPIAAIFTPPNSTAPFYP